MRASLARASRGEIDGDLLAMAANPVRKLMSAIDLEAWLAGLSEDDQILLSMRWPRPTATVGVTSYRALDRVVAKS